MRFLKFLALLPLLLAFQIANSQTIFTVTSTADSGPGTLRQALVESTSVTRTGTFQINFQLPGDGNDNANRTIRLRSALPSLTSKVIIDGSSQANWSALGVSGAKIIIEPEYPNSTFSALTIGQFSNNSTYQTENVEIYGLYLRNFATITNLQTVNTNQGSGIVIDYRTNNVIIGAPGKGNVISGNIHGIFIQNSNFYTNVSPTKFKIQSNLIGLIYDGTTANSNVTGISGALYDCPIDIGGDNLGEGNVIAANRINIDLRRTSFTTTTFDINIINNKIGLDYTGLKDFHELPLYLSSSSLEISGIKIDAQRTQLYIRNNAIGGHRNYGVQILNADFILTGNSIGTDFNGSVNLGNRWGVYVGTNSTGTIGGTTAERNLITYNEFGIETVSSKVVKVTRNSLFCNKVFGIGKTISSPQAFVQILKKNGNRVSGRANPNAEVELFYGNLCGNDLCEGKTYITTVQAGSDGKWEYSAALTGNVIATATFLNATTSPFSTAELLPNEAIVAPVTCNANGSVTIPEEREGFSFSWVKIESNGTRISKGTTQSISGLEVGTYEVTISDGCKAFATQFEIKDQKLTKPVVVPPVPDCGQLTFTFSASVLRGNGNIRFEWYRVSAPTSLVVVGSSVSLPEGNYFVRAIDASGCSLDSDPILISRKPAPKLKAVANNPIVVNASCGKDDGSITNIQLEDVTGMAKYAWYKYDPSTGMMGTTVIATTPELVGYAGGTYSVVITDDGQCSLTITRTIQVLNTMSIGIVTPLGTTCGRNNGSIPNVGIANADTYEWIDPSGVSLGKKVYSPTLNIELKNLAPGTYTLIASQTNSNCQPISRQFVVNAIAPQVFAYSETRTNATCGLVNGSVTLAYALNIEPKTVEWKDESGNVIPGTKREIKNLPAGNYYLFATDVNDCPSTYGPFAIDNIPVLNVTPNSGKPSNDGCTLNRGSISGIEVIGGVAPYRFTWINEAGEPVQYTKELTKAGGGVYRLEVRDATPCGYAISQPYTVEDIPFKLESPKVTDIRVCYVSDIQIPIIGAEEGTYQIFASLTDDAPILESDNGLFKMKVAKTADYYIRRKLGSCFSEFIKLHVEVTYDNLELGNVMTPNGDGNNDTWMVNGLPDFKGNNIKIYTRSGQLVYESTGNYTKPFDGRFRGADLPAGVYFYVIDLRAECKPIGGSITLLR